MAGKMGDKESQTQIEIDAILRRNESGFDNEHERVTYEHNRHITKIKRQFVEL